jgi:aerobic-type carbon monoxide dehydrogenase small subunit (CoxS/CutS family)
LGAFRDDLALTITRRAYGPVEVRDELTMNDFLREHWSRPDKVGCGATQCLACAIIVITPTDQPHQPDLHMPRSARGNRSAPSRAMPGGELTPLQSAFIEHFSFQCGYCTPGFLNEGQVLLEHLTKKPVTRADLEKTIADALDGHLCRCTGYIKYHEAVRDVILADPQRYLI